MNKRQPKPEQNERIVLEGVVKEHGVVATNDGDYLGFPFLTVKGAPIGSRIRVIVYEPVPQD